MAVAESERKTLSWDRKTILGFASFVLIGALIGIGLYLIYANLRISLSPSAGYRIFWMKDECDFVRREFALVKPPPGDPNLISDAILLVKSFACLPGEVIEKKGLKYFCHRADGFVEEVAVAKTRSRKGKPLNPWEPPKNPMVIPDGYYFMANPTRDSYDSRYLGLVPRERIVGCLIPLL